MGDRKISELPLATSLPGDDEYVVPICLDNTLLGISKISIKAMADRITELTLKGNEVEMIITEHGIKFKKSLEKDAKVEMPPLGLLPNSTYKKKRFHDVCAAISRYYNVGWKILIEWVEEHNELINVGANKI